MPAVVRKGVVPHAPAVRFQEMLVLITPGLFLDNAALL